MSRYSFEFKKYRNGQIIMLYIYEHFHSLDVTDEHKFYCKCTDNQYQFEVYVPFGHGHALLNFIISENIVNLKEKKDEYYGTTHIMKLSPKSLLQVV